MTSVPSFTVLGYSSLGHQKHLQPLFYIPSGRDLDVGIERESVQDHLLLVTV